MSSFRSSLEYVKNRAGNLPALLKETLVTRKKGRYLYNEEWDLAVLIDACRWDMAIDSTLAEECFGTPTKVWSVGSNSASWLRRTFNHATKQQLSSTTYVTANPFSETEVPSAVTMDEVWRYGYSEALGTTPPRSVTDRAICHARENTPDRLLVHYMQPHLPPAYEKDGEEFGELGVREWKTENPWSAVQSGKVEKEAVLRAYKKNLDYIVEELDLLLENVEAPRSIITSDHGYAIGEDGEWGHGNFISLVPSVRYVPRWETKATDTGNHSPDTYSQRGSTTREKQLESLGYL